MTNTISTNEPSYTYEILRMDGNSACWVVPDGRESGLATPLSEFSNETGITLPTLKKHASTGQPLSLYGYSGMWTVGECKS